MNIDIIVYIILLVLCVILIIISNRLKKAENIIKDLNLQVNSLCEIAIGTEKRYKFIIEELKTIKDEPRNTKQPRDKGGKFSKESNTNTTSTRKVR